MAEYSDSELANILRLRAEVRRYNAHAIRLKAKTNDSVKRHYDNLLEQAKAMDNKAQALLNRSYKAGRKSKK